MPVDENDEQQPISFEREPGAPFGDPLDIRDPRNVDERSPIEGATHESLGVADSEVDPSRLEDEETMRRPGRETTSEEEARDGEPVNDGDNVRITKQGDLS